MKILFDYDNTLAVTERIGHVEAHGIVSDALSLRGHEFTMDREKFVDRFTGRAFPEILHEIGEEFGCPFGENEVAELNREEFRRSLEALSQGVESTRGAVEALQSLTSSGEHFGIVSNSNFQRIKACLASTGQDRFFPHNENIFSAYDSLAVPKLKPAPDIYLHAFHSMQGDANEFLAVEDSLSGIRAACSAGAKWVVGFVGALSSENARVRARELLAGGAFIVLDDLSLIPLVLSRLRAGDESQLQGIFGVEVWSAKDLR